MKWKDRIFMIKWDFRRFLYNLHPDKEYEKEFKKDQEEFKKIIDTLNK